MCRQSTSYHEQNGIGVTTRHRPHVQPSAAYVAQVHAWFVVWHRLIPSQQMAWRALSKQRREATKTLSAADFAEVMNS